MEEYLILVQCNTATFFAGAYPTEDTAIQGLIDVLVCRDANWMNDKLFPNTIVKVLKYKE